MFTWSRHKIIMLPSNESRSDKKTVKLVKKLVFSIVRLKEELKRDEDG